MKSTNICIVLLTTLPPINGTFKGLKLNKLYKFFIFWFKAYLDHLTISKIRISLPQLRVASHRLCIETGRWQKPQQIPLIDRKCSVCNVLEDEYHFVLECCLYEGLRKKFLPVYYYKRPSRIISPDKARKVVIYPLKTGIYTH